MNKPELLSPIQDLTSLNAAIDAGAGAVYFGIKGFNMREGAKNFSTTDIKKIISSAHKNDIKAYLALNVVVYDSELGKVKKILSNAKKNKIDAVIAWDFSVLELCNKLKIPIHLSTQASVSNFKSLLSYHRKFKIKRVVLARELSLEQIKKIIKLIKGKVEIETFIHGAMCVSISGRCFLSQEVFGKSANRGQCLQPCRRKYVVKDIEENHEFELGDDYVLSPRDLCALPFIEKLIDAGIDSFKIEGRNRSPEYVKTVTECYREAIDNRNFNKTKLLKKLKTAYNRGFSSGFFLGKPVNEWSKTYGSKATKKKLLVGYIKNFYTKLSVAEINVQSYGLKTGDQIMIQGHTTGIFEQKITSMQIDNKKIENIEKGNLVGVKLKKKVRKNDKVYLIR